MATAVSVHFMKNGNGKRENTQMDMDSDDPEFVPLSKRINNLHLHQTPGAGQSSHHSSHSHPLHHHPHHHPHHDQTIPHDHNHGHGHGILESGGALNANSSLSPHSPNHSHNYQNHHHGDSIGSQNPSFGMAGHSSNNPSPHATDFQMNNTCNSSNSQNVARNHNYASGGTGNISMPKSHNSPGSETGMHSGAMSMYSQNPHQHQQNVNVSLHGLHPGIDYNPSLDASSNPHYYESNRELYLLYVERMNRTRQVLHPHFFETQ